MRGFSVPLVPEAFALVEIRNGFNSPAFCVHRFTHHSAPFSLFAIVCICRPPIRCKPENILNNPRYIPLYLMGICRRSARWSVGISPYCLLDRSTLNILSNVFTNSRAASSSSNDATFAPAALSPTTRQIFFLFGR